MFDHEARIDHPCTREEIEVPIAPLEWLSYSGLWLPSIPAVQHRAGFGTTTLCL